MAYKFQIGAAKLSGSTQFNDRVDVIGDIDLSASSIDSVEIAELNAFDTGDLSEGSNLYYTDARVRAAVSAVDASGDGSFSYNSSTGAFTYTGPSASEVRAHLSADGDLVDYNSSTGVISTNASNFSASWDVKMAAADTGDLAEGSNLYHTTGRARAAISVTDAGGDGSLAYNSSTGVITYTGPSTAEVRAHLSSGYMIDFASGEFSIDATEFSSSWDDVLATKTTSDLAEGSNLYHTTARARAAISVNDVSGDGSLSYDSSTGVIEFTGPSATEVRAHLSAGNMLDFASGEFSVNAVAFSASWDAAMAADDTDSLSEGSSNLYHTVARVRAALSDADVISYNSSTGVIGIDAAAMSASIEAASQAYFSGGNMVDISSAGVVSVNAADFSGSWDAAMAADDTDSLSEGSSNLYYTDARARGAVSVTDNGGDGTLSYNSSTGVISYTGPSASEVRAHFSAGTGVAISSGVVSIGQAVATSDSVTFVSGTFTGDMTVAGDLEVQGALTYLNTTNLEIQDNEIILNKGGNLGAGATAGLRLEDGAGQDMIFQWNGSDGQFELLDASGAFQNLKLDNLIASTLDLSAGGAVIEGIQTIAASAGTTAMAQKSIILVGKANTVTLAAAADLQGVVVKIKNNDNACGVDADAIIIESASGENIEGGPSIRLESPGAAIMVISDGSDWFVM